MLTLYSIGVYIGLLLVNFTLASITYHIKAVEPIWHLAKALNKLSVIAIPICIVIDVISLF